MSDDNLNPTTQFSKLKKNIFSIHSAVFLTSSVLSAVTIFYICVGEDKTEAIAPGAILFVFLTIQGLIYYGKFEKPIHKLFSRYFAVSSIWFSVGILLDRFYIIPNRVIKNKNSISFTVVLVVCLSIILTLCTYLLALFVLKVKSDNIKRRETERNEFALKLAETFENSMHKEIDELNKLIVSSKDNLLHFDQMLNKFKDDGVNRLLVAGNLLSLKTTSGLNLLRDYLNQDTDNKIVLLIPHSSQSYVNEIDQRLAIKYLEKIQIFVCMPAWFLQGVFIFGKLTDPNDDKSFEAKGCCFYKVRFKHEEHVTDEGVLIDLNNAEDDVTECRQAINAYYGLIVDGNFSKYGFSSKIEHHINTDPKTLINNPLKPVVWPKLALPT